MAKKAQKSANKSKKNAPSSWVDSVYFSTISIFAKNGSNDGEFLEVAPYLTWGSLTPTKDEII